MLVAAGAACSSGSHPAASKQTSTTVHNRSSASTDGKTATGKNAKTAPVPAGYISVADYVGMNLTAVQKLFATNGLKLNVQYQSPTNISAQNGTILEQDPLADALLRPGGTVTVVAYRSSGSSTTVRTATVPFLGGDTQAQAAHALQEAGLVPRWTQENTTSKSSEGLVVGEAPPAASQVPVGSTVVVGIGHYTG